LVGLDVLLSSAVGIAAVAGDAMKKDLLSATQSIVLEISSEMQSQKQNRFRNNPSLFVSTATLFGQFPPASRRIRKLCNLAEIDGGSPNPKRIAQRINRNGTTTHRPFMNGQGPTRIDTN
jgi:hypothetical protein